MKKARIIAAALAGFLAAPAMAQSGRTSRMPMPAPNIPSAAGGARGGPVQRAIEREMLGAALEYFKEHSPLRAAAYDQMTEEQKRAYNTMIIDRYRAFLSAENDDLRKCLTRQMEIEDTIFDLKRRIDALAAGSPDIGELKEGLHGAVSELVEVRFRERAVRIARMGQLLAEERALLDKDKANQDQIVDQRYEEIIEAQRADPAMAPGEPGRGSGPGEPAGRGPRRGSGGGRSE